MTMIIALGVLILLAGAGFAGGIIGMIKASSSAPRKLSASVALIALVAIVGLSFGEVNAAKAYRAEKEVEQQQADAESKEESDRQKAEEESKQAAEAESTGDESSNEETEEPEEEPEPDWESMDADYLLDKPSMDNGAIRALEMTERDLHRFEEEYGKTYSYSSSNDMEIYRISHAKDEYAFSQSILVNFGDRWYFADNAEDLEYLYSIDTDDVDLDDKVFAKARTEMKDQYAEWEKEFRELKPENNDYEQYARDNFLQELLHNPQATIAWYELMSRHSVFTQNNPWIKENLEAMHKAYKLDPKENELVGTATFLTDSAEHKADEKEEEHEYTHTELNEQMWGWACWGARMFELTDRTGFKNTTSKVRWGLDIDDEYPDLTKPLILDQKKDQTTGYFDIYDVKVNGKTVVKFGMHCSDNGLAEFDTAVPKTTTITKKTTPEYVLNVFYRDKATNEDLLPPVHVGKYPAGHGYGPFEIPSIAGYTAITTKAETVGKMPAADLPVYIWYQKNTGTTETPSDTGTPPSDDNPGSDPGPGPGPKPGGDEPKDKDDSSENQPGNDQGRGDNDDKGPGEQDNTDPGQSNGNDGNDGNDNNNNNDNSNNTGNTDHEGEGAHDSTPDKGDSNPATDTSDNGDKTTTDPGSEKNNGAVSSDDL